MKKICVTEDDPGLQEMYQLILGKAGYEVMIVKDGHDIVTGKFEQPDLFLLDNQRDNINGLDMCTYLKSRNASKNIPVIIVSATPGINKLAIDAGADAAIEKPFNKNQLLQTIASFIQDK